MHSTGKALTGYENLKVWQLAMDLVVEVYELAKRFPREELYSLTDQIKRSAVSIPSNIAEGGSRHSNKEFVRFLYIALGSASELETQLLIVERIGYAQTTSLLKDRLIPIKKMLNALITSRKAR